MIDISSQIANIEAIMALMEKYGIDEVACDFIIIKESHFKTPQPTQEELLTKPIKPASLQDAQVIAANRIAEIEAFINPEKV